MKRSLWTFFFLSFFASLFFSAFFSPLPLVFYAPFLILALSELSLLKCLWLSVLCGILLDLFSASFFASSAINYLAATLCFYPIRKLFNEKPLSLCLSSFVFALFFTCIQFFLFLFFQKTLDLISSCISILLITPLINALYTLLWLIIPTKGLEYAQQIFVHWKHRRKAFDE